jgi:hypothetical protein
MAGLAFDLAINEVKSRIEHGFDSITRFTGAWNYFNAKRMVAMFGEARDIQPGGDIAGWTILSVTEHTGLGWADPGKFPKVGVVELGCPFVPFGQHGGILSLAVATGADRYLWGAFIEPKTEALTGGANLVCFVEGVAVATFFAAGQMEGEFRRLAACFGTVTGLALAREVKIRQLVGSEIGNRGMAETAIDLGVIFARSIACLTDLYKCGRQGNNEEQ